MIIQVLLFVFLHQPTGANIPDSASRYLETPRRAVHTFLHWQLEGHENPALPALTMAADTSLTFEEKQQRSRRLRMVFDAKALSVDYSHIPNDAAFTDSLSGLHTYILFDKLPGVYLTKIDSNWVFSPATVALIPDLYADNYSLAADFLIESLPSWAHRKWWNLELWQFVGVFLIVLGGYLTRTIFKMVMDSFFKKWARKTAVTWDDVLLEETSRPLNVLVTLGFYVLTYANLRLPSGINVTTGLALRVLLGASVVWLLYRLTSVLSAYVNELYEKRQEKLDEHLIPLMRKVLKVLVVVVGSLFVLQNLGLNVGSIVAGLGIGGLAFALAAQDTLANFFGSVMIFVDKPFQIGDQVMVDGHHGIVEEIGFRSTRIRTFEHSVVSIPNAKMADAAINNFGVRPFRRFRTMLGISYSTTPAQVEAFTEGIKALILQSPATRKDAFDVYFAEYAESSLNILLVVHFETNEWNVEMQERHNLLLNIHELAAKLGVQFAFPTRTVHIETLRRETAPGIPDRDFLSEAVKPGSVHFKNHELQAGNVVVNYQPVPPKA